MHVVWQLLAPLSIVTSSVLLLRLNQIAELLVVLDQMAFENIVDHCCDGVEICVRVATVPALRIAASSVFCNRIESRFWARAIVRMASNSFFKA